jgi:hypothetical protein
VDNTTNLYIDALIGGTIVTGSSHASGDTFELYAYGNYDTATSTDLSGGIGTLFAGADQEETLGTDFTNQNMYPLLSILTDAASTTFHFGPISVAQAFGGVLPMKWGIMGRNAGTGALGSGSTLVYTGVTFTSA